MAMDVDNDIEFGLFPELFAVQWNWEGEFDLGIEVSFDLFSLNRPLR